MSRNRCVSKAMVVVIATAAAACTRSTDPRSPASPTPVPVKVAVLQDLSLDGAPQLVTPTFLGLQLALEQAAASGDLPVDPEVVGLDTDGDPSRAMDLVDDVVGDPSYVAVVVAPFLQESASMGDRLASAGVPTLSLSGLEASLGGQGWTSWHRLVPTLPREAGSMASAIRGSSVSGAGVCLVGDGSPYAEALAKILRANLGATVTSPDLTVAGASDLSPTIARVDRSGCGVVAWTGSASAAASLRTSLSAAGLDEPMVGSAAMKTDGYLMTTDGSADGTIVTCGCVDLGTSIRPEAQRFIHDYQSGYGSAPGVFGAEAFDVGGMLAAAFKGGATTRAQVDADLERLTTYRGLANTYRFAPNGELARSSERIETFRAEGLRWIPLGGPDVQGSLPVGTTGFLSVASCHKGRPFAYRQERRLHGFDVELADAVARRLGLRLAWSDRPCEAGLRAVAAGTLDAVLAPTARIDQGTPTSRVALDLRVSLVSRERLAHGSLPLLGRLGPGDTVGVVRGSEALAWARVNLRSNGARLVETSDRSTAYEGLAAGRFAAVVDLEPYAWVAIEHRPTLAVAQTADVGAHDVFVAKGPDAVLIAAIDRALGRVLSSGRYALLYAKYFPGTPIPPATGT